MLNAEKISSLKFFITDDKRTSPGVSSNKTDSHHESNRSVERNDSPSAFSTAPEKTDVLRQEDLPKLDLTSPASNPPDSEDRSTLRPKSEREINSTISQTVPSDTSVHDFVESSLGRPESTNERKSFETSSTRMTELTSEVTTSTSAAGLQDVATSSGEQLSASTTGEPTLGSSTLPISEPTTTSTTSSADTLSSNSVEEAFGNHQEASSNAPFNRSEDLARESDGENTNPKNRLNLTQPHGESSPEADDDADRNKTTKLPEPGEVIDEVTSTTGTAVGNNLSTLVDEAAQRAKNKSNLEEATRAKMDPEVSTVSELPLVATEARQPLPSSRSTQDFVAEKRSAHQDEESNESTGKQQQQISSITSPMVSGTTELVPIIGSTHYEQGIQVEKPAVHSDGESDLMAGATQSVIDKSSPATTSTVEPSQVVRSTQNGQDILVDRTDVSTAANSTGPTKNGLDLVIENPSNETSSRMTTSSAGTSSIVDIASDSSLLATAFTEQPNDTGPFKDGLDAAIGKPSVQENDKGSPQSAEWPIPNKRFNPDTAGATEFLPIIKSTEDRQDLKSVSSTKQANGESGHEAFTPTTIDPVFEKASVATGTTDPLSLNISTQDVVTKVPPVQGDDKSSPKSAEQPTSNKAPNPDTTGTAELYPNNNSTLDGQDLKVENSTKQAGGESGHEAFTSTTIDQVTEKASGTTGTTDPLPLNISTQDAVTEVPTVLGDDKSSPQSAERPTSNKAPNPDTAGASGLHPTQDGHDIQATEKTAKSHHVTTRTIDPLPINSTTQNEQDIKIEKPSSDGATAASTTTTTPVLLVTEASMLRTSSSNDQTRTSTKGDNSSLAIGFDSGSFHSLPERPNSNQPLSQGTTESGSGLATTAQPTTPNPKGQESTPDLQQSSPEAADGQTTVRPTTRKPLLISTEEDITHGTTTGRPNSAQSTTTLPTIVGESPISKNDLNDTSDNSARATKDISTPTSGITSSSDDSSTDNRNNRTSVTSPMAENPSKGDSTRSKTLDQPMIKCELIEPRICSFT